MRRNAGFTLIEIMIVVMIVGLLMTTIATQLIGRAQRAQVDLARTRMLQVEQALELYRLDNGRYPTTQQGLLALFYQLGLPHVMGRFVGASLFARVSLAVLLLAPLGLCLGAFMPIGLKTLASLTVHQREYVAWGWAVNGFFSVTSSVLATILSMTFGFGFVLLLAAVVYAIGVLALWRVPQPPAQA